MRMPKSKRIISNIYIYIYICSQILGEINSNKLKIQELEDDRFDLEKKLKSYEDVDGTIKSYEKEIEMNNLEFEKL